MGMRPSYPSDISREQFEQIRPLLESARKKTAPRKVDLYDVFCAVLYLLRSGCQWRMLPFMADRTSTNVRSAAHRVVFHAAMASVASLREAALSWWRCIGTLANR